MANAKKERPTREARLRAARGLIMSRFFIGDIAVDHLLTKDDRFMRLGKLVRAAMRDGADELVSHRDDRSALDFVVAYCARSGIHLMPVTGRTLLRILDAKKKRRAK